MPYEKKSKPKPLPKASYRGGWEYLGQPCEEVLQNVAPIHLIERWLGRLSDHLLSRIIKGGRDALEQYRNKLGIPPAPGIPKKQLRPLVIECARDFGIEADEEWLKTVLPNRGGRGLRQEEIHRRMQAIDFYYPDFKAAAKELQLTENLVRRTYENYKLEGGRYVRVYRYGQYAGRGIDGTENR